MRDKQALSLQGQCRRKAGAASGTEQKLPAAQERSTEEQAVPCSPWTPCRADLHVQPWKSPWCSSGCGLKEVQPTESSLLWRLMLEQHAPKGWTLWYRAMLEQCLESCSLREAHTGSVWEGQHPMEGHHMKQGQKVTRDKALGADCNPIPHSPVPLRGRR